MGIHSGAVVNDCDRGALRRPIWAQRNVDRIGVGIDAFETSSSIALFGLLYRPSEKSAMI